MFNVERSQPEPSSLAIEKLKSKDAYRNADVLYMLQQDFFNKCYLCEEKEISAIEVDHLKPHFNGAYLDRKFDWNNLFFCCRHCNGTKAARDVPLLDCTNCDNNMYSSMCYKFRSFPAPSVIIESFSKDCIATTNTVELLNQIYSGKDPDKVTNRVMEASNIREKIRKEIDHFLEVLNEPHDVEKLTNMLSKKSAFSAFKRQIIKDHYSNLEIYFD